MLFWKLLSNCHINQSGGKKRGLLFSQRHCRVEQRVLAMRQRPAPLPRAELSLSAACVHHCSGVLTYFVDAEDFQVRRDLWDHRRLHQMETSSKCLFLDSFPGDSGPVVQTGAHDRHLLRVGKHWCSHSFMEIPRSRVLGLRVTLRALIYSGISFTVKFSKSWSRVAGRPRQHFPQCSAPNHLWNPHKCALAFLSPLDQIHQNLFRDPSTQIL